MHPDVSGVRTLSVSGLGDRAEAMLVRADTHRPRTLAGLGRVRLPFGVGQPVEHFEEHAEVAVGGQVGDPDATERATEHERVSPAPPAPPPPR